MTTLGTSSSYPNETSGLLSQENQTRPDTTTTNYWTLWPFAVIVLLLVPTSVNLYQAYFDSPIKREKRLIAKYETLANESMTLLNTNTSTVAPSGCQATVLILRHCEDLGGHVRYADGTSHCSYLGFQRSVYLATLFGNTSDTTARWPLPSQLFGMWNHDGTNKRQYEVLRPLSDKADVQIQMVPFDTATQQLQNTLFPLLQSGTFCNRVAVVAWKHKFIRELAATLGCDAEKGCPGGDWDDYEFDTVWELQYVYQPEALRAYPNNQSVHHHKAPVVDDWKVFGSVTREYFDALAFQRGAYGDEDKNWMQHSGDGHTP